MRPCQHIDFLGLSETIAARLYVVPDFGWTGDGVRIDGLVPGSAAAAAGLRDGDVLLRFNGEEVADLQSYSDLLRNAAPGDVVVVEFRRQQQILQAEATLSAR